MSIIILLVVLLSAKRCSILAFTTFYQHFPIHQCNEEVQILLTFDDSPNPIYTKWLMEMLKEDDTASFLVIYGVVATLIMHKKQTKAPLNKKRILFTKRCERDRGIRNRY